MKDILRLAKITTRQIPANIRFLTEPSHNDIRLAVNHLSYGFMSRIGPDRN